MKKSFLLFVLACFAFAGVLAQTGEIANLQVSMRTDGSGLVDIHFDLNGTGAFYNLQFEASFDDGANYEPLSETYLTGELNDVLPGAGKHIIWDGKASHPETFSTQTRVRVVAIEQIFYECGDTFIDARDGNEYATVKIGNQCWMAQNLAYLPQVNPASQGSATDPFYYVYGYQSIDVNEAKATDNYQNYGVIYNWAAALTACPEGWQPATDADWNQLVEHAIAQGFPNTGNDPNGVGNALKSCRQVSSPLAGDCATTDHPRWNSNATYFGFDEFGFAGLPGGFRNLNGFFDLLGSAGYFWTSTGYSETNAWFRFMFYDNAATGFNNSNKSSGFSIRCINRVC